MSKVSIGIDAQLDTSNVEQKINDMGRKIADANKIQFNPISIKSIEQLAQYEKQFNQLLRVHGELSKRMKATGQSEKGFLGTDYAQMYPDKHAHAQQVRKIMEYTLGPGTFSDLAPLAPKPKPSPGVSPHPGRPGRGGGAGLGDGAHGGGGGVGPVVMPAVNAGLRAIGPAGGVAANSLSAGLSGGFGAGMAGLLGGMLALGVGKIVSSAMEHVTQAEDNSVAMDRLKRSLGDVNVAFDGLKAVVNGGADNLKVTYSEFGKLTTQFAKAGNANSNYLDIGKEVGLGGGLSRAFGLDPTEGVGVLGQVRGVGATKDLQDSRRFALLIGETIAKSDAFAKADEVMSALGNYAVSQTRAGVNVANTSGYAGTYSGLVSGNFAGMDPAGAAAILGRVNSSLSAGGARGEASQFFTGAIGADLGINPYQMKILREGGAFATPGGMLGDGSTYARYKGGNTGISGDKTFLQSTIDRLRKQYGNGSDELADATASHLGIGVNQAMALLSVDPKQMGGMSQYANLTNLSGGGIGNLSKVLYGTDSDRKGVADSLMRRSDVSQSEKDTLDTAMRSGNAEDQKRVLAELVASRDQEQTTGTYARDTKNAVENIKTNMADKLVPYMNEMRLGIMAIAGVGDKGATTDSIMRKVLDADSKGRRDAIEGESSEEEKTLGDRLNRLSGTLLRNGSGTREEQEREFAAIQKRLGEIQRKKTLLLEQENLLHEREIRELNERAAKRAVDDLNAKTKPISESDIIDGAAGYNSMNGNAGPDAMGSLGGGVLGIMPGSLSGGGSGGNGAAKKEAAMKFFIGKGWSREQAAGIVSNLWAESQMNPRAVGDRGKAKGIAQWHPDRQREFERWSGKSIDNSTVEEQMEFTNYELTQGKEKQAGDRLRATTTARESGAVVSRYYERPQNVISEASSRGADANQLAGASNPDGGRIQVEIVHKNEKGQEIAPRQIANTRVVSNWATPAGFR